MEKPDVFEGALIKPIKQEFERLGFDISCGVAVAGKKFDIFATKTGKNIAIEI